MEAEEGEVQDEEETKFDKLLAITCNTQINLNKALDELDIYEEKLNEALQTVKEKEEVILSLEETIATKDKANEEHAKTIKELKDIISSLQAKSLETITVEENKEKNFQQKFEEFTRQQLKLKEMEEQLRNKELQLQAKEKRLQQAQTSLSKYMDSVEESLKKSYHDILGDMATMRKNYKQQQEDASIEKLMAVENEMEEDLPAKEIVTADSSECSIAVCALDSKPQGDFKVMNDNKEITLAVTNPHTSNGPMLIDVSSENGTIQKPVACDEVKELEINRHFQIFGDHCYYSYNQEHTASANSQTEGRTLLVDSSSNRKIIQKDGKSSNGEKPIASLQSLKHTCKINDHNLGITDCTREIDEIKELKINKHIQGTDNHYSYVSEHKNTGSFDSQTASKTLLVHPSYDNGIIQKDGTSSNDEKKILSQQLVKCVQEVEDHSQDMLDDTREMGDHMQKVEGHCQKMAGDIREIEDEAREMEGHTQEFEDHSQEMLGDTQKIEDHYQKTADDTREIEDDGRKIKGHTQEIEVHCQKMAEDTREMEDEAREMKDHAQEIEDHSQEMVDATRKMEGHTQETADDTREIIESNAREMKDHTQEIEDHSQEMLGDIRKMEDDVRKIDHTQEMEDQSQEIVDDTRETEAHSQEMVDDTQEMENHAQKIEDHCQKMANGIQEMEDDAIEMEDLCQEMEDDTRQMENHSQKMEDHVQEMADHSHCTLVYDGVEKTHSECENKSMLSHFENGAVQKKKISCEVQKHGQLLQSANHSLNTENVSNSTFSHDCAPAYSTNSQMTGNPGVAKYFVSVAKVYEELQKKKSPSAYDKAVKYSYKLFKFMNTLKYPDLDYVCYEIIAYFKIFWWESPTESFPASSDFENVLRLDEQAFVRGTELALQEGLKIQSIVSRILDYVVHFMKLSNLDIIHLKSIVRIYAALCKQINDKVKFRVLIFTILKSYKAGLYLVAIIASVWPEVLQAIIDGGQRDHILSQVISYVLFTKPSELDDDLWNYSVHVFKTLCKLSMSIDYKLQFLLDKLFSGLADHAISLLPFETDKHSLTTIFILIGRHGWEWSFQHIVIPYLVAPFENLVEKPRILALHLTILADLALEFNKTDEILHIIEKFMKSPIVKATPNFVQVSGFLAANKIKAKLSEKPVVP